MVQFMKYVPMERVKFVTVTQYTPSSSKGLSHILQRFTLGIFAISKTWSTGTCSSKLAFLFYSLDIHCGYTYRNKTKLKQLDSGLSVWCNYIASCLYIRTYNCVTLKLMLMLSSSEICTVYFDTAKCCCFPRANDWTADIYWVK